MLTPGIPWHSSDWQTTCADDGHEHSKLLVQSFVTSNHTLCAIPAVACVGQRTQRLLVPLHCNNAPPYILSAIAF